MSLHPVKGQGLKVVKLEYSLKLEIKCNDWLYFESENELMLNNPEAMLPCWPIEDSVFDGRSMGSQGSNVSGEKLRLIKL